MKSLEQYLAHNRTQYTNYYDDHLGVLNLCKAQL